jgi:hypothetical protein
MKLLLTMIRVWRERDKLTFFHGSMKIKKFQRSDEGGSRVCILTHEFQIRHESLEGVLSLAKKKMRSPTPRLACNPPCYPHLMKGSKSIKKWKFHLFSSHLFRFQFLGIEYLYENHLLKHDPQDVAQFLYKGEGLNKTAIG